MIITNLPNAEYWARRTEKHALDVWKDVAKTESTIKRYYLKQSADLKQLLAKFYSDYAIDNHLTYAQATQALRGRYLQEVLFDIDGTYSLQREINRLEGLNLQIDKRLSELHNTTSEQLTNQLMLSYADGYYYAIYSAQAQVGVGTAFNLLNTKALEIAISQPYLGEFYSDRLWHNKELLTRNLKRVLTDGIVNGKSYKSLARDLADVMDTNYSYAKRVIRTENANIYNQATAKGYEESGMVKRYQILATLDNRTSKKCQREDLKIYDLKDKEVGVNFPPFHVNCRSTIVTYRDDRDLSELTRIARDAETGKNYKVPRNTSYQEWKKQYVDGKVII